MTRCSVLILILARATYAGVMLVDMKCIPNKMACKEPVCDLNRTVDGDNPYLSSMTFGCQLVKEVPRLTGKLKIFLKVKKSYTPVSNNMNVDLDFCKMSTILNSQVFNTFAPKLSAEVAEKFHPCPYTDIFMVEDFKLDGKSIQSVPGWQNTKAQLSFFRGCCIPLFTVDFFIKAD